MTCYTPSLNSLPFCIEKKAIYVCLVFFLFIAISMHAQLKMSETQPDVFKSNGPLHFFNSFYMNSSNVSMTNSNIVSSANTPLYIKSGSINDLPFFCAMECRVRKHTNIWIKLRTGNDDSYMKMISQGQK